MIVPTYNHLAFPSNNLPKDPFPSHRSPASPSCSPPDLRTHIMARPSSEHTEFSGGQDQLGLEGQDLASSFIFNVEHAGSTPQQPRDEEDSSQTLQFWDRDYSQNEFEYFSGSDVSASPSPSHQEFPYSPDIESSSNNEHPSLRLNINSPHYGMAQNWPDVLSSPEFLHPGLRHRRSHSTESSRSFGSSGEISSSSSHTYLTPSSSAYSSTENLHLDSLDMSESKEDLHSTLFNFPDSSVNAAKSVHGDGQDNYASGMAASPSGCSSMRILAPHQASTPALNSSPGVSIREMLKLLSESGNQLIQGSADPDRIRQTFIETLQRKGGRGNGLSNFSKPTKMEVGTTATLKASERRRKTEASFFCELCKTGFTRKNGLINHYRSHLGIADKTCVHCGRGFTTSLTRHMKKCKSNPNRIATKSS